MSTNHTPNYQLSQWEKTDQVLMDDFNADNAAIDAALKAGADARTALSGQLAKKGNCRIRSHVYVGNGACGLNNPTVVNFTGHPDFFVIYGGQGVMFGAYGEEATLLSTDQRLVPFQVTPQWTGNQCKFSLAVDSPYPQLNVSGLVYHVVEFYQLI